jgi:hypothetical protein
MAGDPFILQNYFAKINLKGSLIMYFSAAEGP